MYCYLGRKCHSTHEYKLEKYESMKSEWRLQLHHSRIATPWLKTDKDWRYCKALLERPGIAVMFFKFWNYIGQTLSSSILELHNLPGNCFYIFCRSFQIQMTKNWCRQREIQKSEKWKSFAYNRTICLLVLSIHIWNKQKLIHIRKVEEWTVQNVIKTNEDEGNSSIIE